MSYHNPTDTEVSVAGLDAAITSIQEAIKANLTWIDKVFHRAYLFQESAEDGRLKVMIPKCWESGNEYINVLPNDSIQSQLFFIPTSDEESTEYDPHVSSTYTCDIALVFWCDTRFIPDNTKTSYGPSLGNVKKLLMQTLEAHDRVTNITSIVDRSAEEIFEGFTINDDQTHYTMLPYAGMRINFTISYNYKSC